MLGRYRLHWYAQMTARLVLRRWQALVLIVGICAPAFAPLLERLESLGFPLLTFFSPRHGGAWNYAYLVALQLFAVGWAMAQREQILGGEFMQYAASLPISRSHRRGVDTLILLLADSPLLLPPLAAIGWQIGHDDPAPLTAMHTLFVIEATALMIFIQLAMLEDFYQAWYAVTIANLFLVATLAYDDLVFQGLMLTLSPLSVFYGSRFFSLTARNAFSYTPLRQQTLTQFRSSRLRVLSGVQISALILLRQSPSILIVKILLSTAITAATLSLLNIWEYDARSVPFATIALACIALVICGLYRDLHKVHQAAAPFIDALPLPRQWPRKFDIAVVLTLSLPFAALINSAMWTHHALTTTMVIPVMLTYFALLGLLRVPQIHAERHAVVVNALMAALWTSGVIFLVA